MSVSYTHLDVYKRQPGEWRVQPGPILAADLTIEPDLSNAAPFLAAALVAGGSVSVPHWPVSTTQVGNQLRTLLEAFGARVDATQTGDTQTVTVQGSGPLRGVDLSVPEAGELAPTLVGLAALAAHGTGTGDGVASRIVGIGHIRHHETDRIAALVHEINALGGRAEELEDGIALHPATLHGGTWGAYADPVSYTHLDVYKRQAPSSANFECAGDPSPLPFGVPIPCSLA